MRFISMVVLIALLAPLPSRADGGPIQLQRDEANHRVWILRRDAVYAYDARTSRLVRRVELADWAIAGTAYACPPDLALAPSGEVLVTSNVLPVVWSINPATFASRRHVLAVDAYPQRDFGFSMLAFSGGDVFGYSAATASLWRLDLRAGEAHRLRTTGPLRALCRGMSD